MNPIFRKEIIVFYSDLVSSTKTVKKLSKEQVAGYYSLFLNEMTDVIYDFGGYVLKFVGDCILGYYILPDIGWLGVVDSSISCVTMMQHVMNEAIQPEAEKRGITGMACRIGIDCGEIQIIKVGSEGRYINYDFFGDVMNTTKKVCDRGVAHNIIIGNAYEELLFAENKTRCELIEPLKIGDAFYRVFNYHYD
jgi:class 3 adenylate cyclase